MDFGNLLFHRQLGAASVTEQRPQQLIGITFTNISCA